MFALFVSSLPFLVSVEAYHHHESGFPVRGNVCYGSGVGIRFRPGRANAGWGSWVVRFPKNEKKETLG